MSGNQRTREAGPALAPSHRCVACGAENCPERCGHCGVSQRVGEFQILKVLTQNARGRLYLAHNAQGRRVALKELVFATVPDVAQIDAFEREAEVLRQLSHPNIPRFVASFRTSATRSRLRSQRSKSEPRSSSPFPLIKQGFVQLQVLIDLTKHKHPKGDWNGD